MKRIFILAACFLSACAGEVKKTDEGNVVKDIRVIDTASVLSGCYTAVLQKDTANLVIQHEQGAESVSGDLVLNNFEKDNNKGTLNAKIKGNLIVGFYKYFSEGSESVRQVVFKVEGDTLLEGYGNLMESGDTTFFKNIEELNYLTEKPYIKRDCK